MSILPQELNHGPNFDSDVNPVVIDIRPQQEVPSMNEIISYRNKDDEDMISKVCISFWFTVFVSPFIICDMYFAFNDKSCVNQTFVSLQVNMFVYLLVNSIIGIIVVLITYSIIFIFDRYEELTEIVICCSKFISHILNGFFVIWTMVGCMIFWGYMDKSKCSKIVYDYLFVKLFLSIVTITSMVFKCCKNNNE
jgi:hypothetical protein